MCRFCYSSIVSLSTSYRSLSKCMLIRSCQFPIIAGCSRKYNLRFGCLMFEIEGNIFDQNFKLLALMVDASPPIRHLRFNTFYVHPFKLIAITAHNLPTQLTQIEVIESLVVVDDRNIIGKT